MIAALQGLRQAPPRSTRSAPGCRGYRPAVPTDAAGAGPGFTDLGYARVDTARLPRTGDPESVYAAGKTPEQTCGVARALVAAHPERAVLVTRADRATVAAVLAAFPGAVADPEARTLVVGPLPAPRGRVLVVAAGTSDGPVAGEAAVSAAVHGAGVARLTDVGVAGVHRLLAARDALAAADCLSWSSPAWTARCPAWSAGWSGRRWSPYRRASGTARRSAGSPPLLTMLNSCAPGVVVVNIDNGFGAGVFAARVPARSATGGDAVIGWLHCLAGRQRATCCSGPSSTPARPWSSPGVGRRGRCRARCCCGPSRSPGQASAPCRSRS